MGTKRMRNPIKLIIKYKKEYSPNWRRFEPCDKIIIDDNSSIKTEAQLCNYIYLKHGEGRFMVLAWQKGVKGLWCFWLGWIKANGFIRDLGKNKELEKLKVELQKANKSQVDYDERELIEEEIDMEREFSKEIGSGATRRGPIGLIKSRPGMLHQYEEF